MSPALMQLTGVDSFASPGIFIWRMNQMGRNTHVLAEIAENRARERCLVCCVSGGRASALWAVEAQPVK